MSEEIIDYVYHLKGGNKDAIEEVDPLLDRREPLVIFDADKTYLKIGDGQNTTNQLPYISNPYLENKLEENTNKLENIENQIQKPTFDPIFANNSWEKIAEAARLSVAQNYWKVGDYKMLDFPIPSSAELGELTDINEVATKEDFALEINNMDKFVSYFGSEDRYFVTLMIDYAVNRIAIHFSLQGGGSLTNFYTEEYNGDISVDGTYFRCGLVAKKLNPDFTYDNIVWLETEVTITSIPKSFPVQIIGFNHDKVSNPYIYGRQKAGITLQLGVSRNIYGDAKPSLFTGTIPGLMTDEGYFKAPNKLYNSTGSYSDLYPEEPTNWKESGFRLALQSLFDKTEIANYIVPVQKYTSKYYQSNIYWSDALLTNDKVFLPSEYEVFGQQILAPYIEGEQYEFYRDGYSKFMWSDKLLNGTSTVGRLWLRSAYAKKVNEIKADSNYSLNVYLGVNSLNPVSVLYSPSYATAGDGVIAPCFCL